MKNLISLILALAVCVSSHAQVNVQKTSGTNAITGNLVIGDGKTLLPTGTGNITATNLAGGATGAVTSIAGTANQIAASAATGAVTLSIPTNPTLPGNVTVSGTTGVIVATDAKVLGPTNSSIQFGAAYTRVDFPAGGSFAVREAGSTIATFAGSTGNFTSVGNIIGANIGVGTLDFQAGLSLTIREAGSTVATFAGSTGNFTTVGNLTSSGTGLQTIGGAASTVRMPGYGAGAATFDSSGNITSVSDARMKDIDRPFTTGLSALRKLTPQVYHWKKESGLNTGDVNVSLIAQDLIAAGVPEAVFTERTVDVMEEVEEKVEVVVPEPFDPAGKAFTTRTATRIVSKPKLDKDGKVMTQRVPSNYTVSDRAVIAVLVNAIKELDARVAKLEGR